MSLNSGVVGGVGMMPEDREKRRWKGDAGRPPHTNYSLADALTPPRLLQSIVFNAINHVIERS